MLRKNFGVSIFGELQQTANSAALTKSLADKQIKTDAYEECVHGEIRTTHCSVNFRAD